MTKEEAINEYIVPAISRTWNDDRCKEILEALEQDQWIPISERYPTDANKDYLVCYEDGCITIEHLYFDDDGYPFFSKMELGVVAWMPLPKPYK